MFAEIAKIVADRSRDWRPEPPASEDTLAKLARQAGRSLPREYIAFLSMSNGGSGELGIEPGWFVLWPAGEVVAHNADYKVEEFVPGHFGFGSSGGGELLAFDTRRGEPWPLVMIPFIPMTTDEAVVIATDFAEFARAIGRSLDQKP